MYVILLSYSVTVAKFFDLKHLFFVDHVHYIWGLILGRLHVSINVRLRHSVYDEVCIDVLC
jgi:hypothetical protein